MDNKHFNIWNKVCAALAFVVSAVTYLLTIEPTASFWDCGEFIASSYKLEVGHPPGNPVFQLIARLFTLFSEGQGAAVAVNAMSAICSALTIFFLYLTIVFLVKRIVKREDDGSYALSSAITIFASGLVGALAYCFSDTFWFSAVEGEVYAMSSLFTAAVFWAMTKWYDQADEPHSLRWIVLIAFLMGLSIGVHLLNLLTIPCLFFLFYFRKKEDGRYSFWQLAGVFLLSCVVLLLVMAFIQYLPKTAAFFDRIFVNGFHLPFNSGAAFFMVLLLLLCFVGIYLSWKKDKVWLNTVILCFTTLVIGFSIFSIVIIRSSVKTPTNEYQPDNPYTLVRYLGREQYGSNPLIYGQTYDAAYELEDSWYWAPMGDRYIKARGQVHPVYDSKTKMLFPRMWSSDERHRDFYDWYVYDGASRPRSVNVDGRSYEVPTMGQNLKYFFGYQLNWMYWRYFMWNFVGRQNDIHSPVPGDPFKGNWESGVGFIDRLMLGDQRDAPEALLNNPGKNHYFFLPLLLGLIGLLFQSFRDKRGAWVTFLLFFMTGIAIVIYLNQPPYQVRERDYAYAGSFYAFSIWIGLGVAALAGWVNEKLGSGTARVGGSLAVSLLCMGVPVLMACQNWDDHDRSNRYTAVEIARNYLNSVGENGILVTHGDNDTFPLWYAQEVENVRTDVRICNTSLLGTDWYIDQMKYACNKSAPLKLSVGPEQYLYGTNELVYIYDKRDTVVPLKDVMAVFRSPKAKLTLSDGSKVNYICSKRFSIPVNKENCLKYGIVPEKYADRIPDSITLTLKGRYLSKPELFMLDLLSNYEWDRPINMLSMGGEIEVGMKEYLLYDGFSFRFVPIKNSTKSTDIGLSDPDDLYHKMTEVFTWDALKRTDWLVDYQNYYTFCGVMSQRLLFVNAAKEMLKVGDKDRALELLNRCQECVPRENFPLDMSWMGFSNELMVLEMISLYYYSGDADSARALAADFSEELISASVFYAEFYDYCKREFDSERMVIASLVDMLIEEGDGELARNIESSFKLALGVEDR